MSRVCVLGHRGMLGHVVARYLKESGLEVVTIADRFRGAAEGDTFLSQIRRLNPDWCVNCIGVRAGDAISETWTDEVNHLLPALCSRGIPDSCGLVHASSDAVFSPTSGPHQWHDQPDATDVYGASKRAAETALSRDNDFLIRCSIVGPELGQARSLLGWLQAQSGDVNGYVNQHWNGITTLQWAKECAAIIDAPLIGGRIVQPACEPIVTKGELLELISQVWGLSCRIRQIEGPVSVYRPLISNRSSYSLPVLLAELRTWY